MSWKEPACPAWDEIEVTDPDAAAAEADLDDVDETLAAFSSWVGGASVCVAEVRLVTTPDADDDDIGGFYRHDEHLVVVGLDTSMGVQRVTSHELCHALDHAESFSETWSELLPDSQPDDEHYPTEELKLAENFARSCELGPPPRALAEATEAACGPGDPWRAVLRDEVFGGYTEEISIGVGEWLSVTSLAVPPLPDGAAVVGAVASEGGLGVVYQVAEGYRVARLDLATLTWGDSIEVSETGWGSFVPTLPDAEPVLSWIDEGGEVSLWELRDGALVDPGLDWLIELMEEEDFRSTYTLDAENVVWQRWNDGEPLQQRSRGGDDAQDVPGAGDLALHPTAVPLPEGQFVWHFRSLAPTMQPYLLDEDGVSPFAAPVGVSPMGSTPGGGVVAQGGRYGSEGDYSRPWILRDPDGAWLLDPSTCDEAFYGSWATAGDRTYRFSSAGGDFIVEEVTVGGE